MISTSNRNAKQQAQFEKRRAKHLPAIKALWDQGCNISSITKELDLSRDFVTKCLEREGLWRRRTNGW